MRVIFWGTPETAVPFAEFLSKRAELVAIVTQPDQPSQRGQKIQKSPVKIFSETKKIPAFQPSNLKDPEFISQLRALNPETAIVVAYGKILPAEVIRIFPGGIFNIHFSLLPHLRGAAPIQWAILRGDQQTGVTLFKISESLDTGNILSQKQIGISINDNAVTLEEKLVSLGLLALEEMIDPIEKGNSTGKPQIGETTYAPRFKKEDAQISWEKPSEEIARQVRALIRMGAFTHLPNGKIIKILQAEPQKADMGPTAEGFAGPSRFLPGSLAGIEKGRGFLVKCELGNLLIIKVRPEGKKEMDAWSFYQGARLQIGDRLQ